MQSIEVVFFIDLIVNFMFSFINEKGDEIVNPKEIAIHYLKHRFVIDLISLFPFDRMSHEEEHLSYLKIFKLIKIIGVLRLQEIINYLNLTKRTKQFLGFG